MLELDFRPEQIKGLQLIAELGHGATASVYLGKYHGKDVAVKVLSRNLASSESMMKRLEREAKVLTDLKHPNIVEGMEYGLAGTRPYFIMEFIQGETLSARLKRKGVLPEDEVRDLAHAVLNALSYAHQAGIIHRDIKPANIIRADDGTIKLMDFGLARQEDDPLLTTAGQIIGTPAFLSPEQARGESDLDCRSDLYALGVTMFYLVTGKIPFYSKNVSLILTRKVTDDVPDVRQFDVNLSLEFSYIIKRLCSRHRYDRPDDPEAALRLFSNVPAEDLTADPFETRSTDDSSVMELAREQIEINDPTLETVVNDTALKSQPINLPKHEILFYEDEESSDAYLLLSGKAEILRAGRQVAVIDTVGTFIGEMSPLRDAPRSATVRALEDCTLQKIAGEEFEAFLKRHPNLAVKLAGTLAERLEQTTDRLSKVEDRLSRIFRNFKNMMVDLK